MKKLVLVALVLLASVIVLVAVLQGLVVLQKIPDLKLTVSQLRWLR